MNRSNYYYHHNPNYKHGIYIKEREWKEAVLLRDKFTCQECGNTKKQKRIDTHHIKARDKYPELIYDLDNGISLCISCHRSIHRKGKKASLKTRRKQSKSHIGQIVSSTTRKN